MGWILYGVAAGVALLALWNPSAQRRRARGSKLAFRYQMYVEPTDIPGFDALLDRERRARCACAGILLTLLAVAFSASLRAPDRQFDVSYAVGGSVAVAAVWATVVTSARLPLRQSLWDPSTTTTLDAEPADYVHPLLRIWTGSVALCGFALALRVWSSLSEQDDIGTALLALVPVWAFVFSELGVRLTARMPRDVHAGRRYAVEAMRSEMICWGYGLGLYFSLLAAMELTSRLSDRTSVAVGAALLFIPAAAVLQRPKRSYLRFRTRLWPELTDDQIVHTSAEELPA